MNLLVVDDDKYVLEDIEESVDIAKFGIHYLFTALNVFQAKNILEKQIINIIITDIDMPGGTGLELITYVREKYPDIQIFFITCHADFRYAQQAIRLGGLDYLLKPLDYEEVERNLSIAVERLQGMQRQEAEYEHALANQDSIRKQFWLDVIRRAVPTNLSSVVALAGKRGVELSSEMMVLPVLICNQYRKLSLEAEEKSLIDFEITNIGEELLTDWNQSGILMSLEPQQFLLLYCIQEPELPYLKDLKKRLMEYISVCHKYCYVILSAYMGKATTADQLADMVEQLQQKDQKNLVLYNRVFTWEEKQVREERESIPLDMRSWDVFIENGYSQRVMAEIEQYFKQVKESGHTSVQQLVRFQQDLLQVIYKALAAKDIQAHEIFESKEVMALHKQSLESVDKMIKWCQLVFVRVDSYYKKYDKVDDQIQRVKAYVHANLQQELSREEIAKMLYLHPDYLDRLFKKKVNMSVSKYIMQERMAYAKLLLTETDLSISEIANNFGYNNLSNFSTMFKKMEGFTPAEYRKRYRNGNEVTL